MNYYETDPEFMERFEHFAFDEVVNEEGQQLEPGTRNLAILATLIGCQGLEAYKEMLPRALDDGLSPVEVKETVYQAADYLGMGRMWQFLNATNEIFSEKKIALLLPSQATTTMGIVLKKECRYRRRFSANICRKHGRADISTGGLRRIVSVIIIPAPDWILRSAS